MDKLSKGIETELFVEKLAFGGKAVARMEGFVIFLDRAVPGQRVKARIIKKKRNFAEARVIDVLSQSPDYRAPFCPHFGTCGGCHLQDMAYDVQLRWKRQHVLESLGHIAGVSDAEVLPIVPSPLTSYYRNKMEFTFTNRRWLLPEELEQGEFAPESRFALGLHVRGLFDKVFDLRTCFLESPEAVAILTEVREWAKRSGLPAYSVKTHDGFWRFLVIRHAKHTGQILAHLITTGAPKADRNIDELSNRLRSEFPALTTFIHSVNDKKSQVAAGDFSRVLFGPGWIEEMLGDLRFRISAHSFFQTNTLGAEKLYDAVARMAEFGGAEHVWDLYCGTGSIGIYIASQVKSVTGIEVVEEAISDAHENCRINGIDNCTFLAGDLKEVIRQAVDAGLPDVVIVDPPRAGMHPKVVKTLLEILPKRIIAVSCNPASLARDAALLLDSYEIRGVEPFDLFPHTPHLECVVRLDRKN